MAEIIRYGAGGVPYKGTVGPTSTEEVVAPEPVEEKEPEVFDNFNQAREEEIKEPEMFEESNLEEDFEIPAFLRKQKN